MKCFKTADYILKILLFNSSISFEFSANLSICPDMLLFCLLIIFSWAEEFSLKCTYTHTKQIIEMTLTITDAINVPFDSSTIINKKKKTYQKDYFY